MKAQIIISLACLIIRTWKSLKSPILKKKKKKKKKKAGKCPASIEYRWKSFEPYDDKPNANDKDAD